MGGRLTFGPEQFSEDLAAARRTAQRLVELPWERLVMAHGDELPTPRLALARLIGDTATKD
jgi:hypothetical protein